MKTFLQYTKVFFILIASFFVFSVLSCLLPYEWVKKNMEASVPELMAKRHQQEAILKGEGKSTFELIKSIFILSLLWFVGFACAWAIKWVLVVILVDASQVQSTINTILFRASTDEFSRWDAVVRNFQLLPLVWLTIVLTLLLLLTIFNFNKKGIPLSIAFLLVALFPYTWYWVLANHTYLHYWFTYRGQIISMSCAMLFFISLIDWERLKYKLKMMNH